MADTSRQELLRAIPPVDTVLADSAIVRLREEHPHLPMTELVRASLDRLRAGASPGGATDRASLLAHIVADVEADVHELRTGGLRRVINATGVVLHTNLGRAVLGEAAARAADEAMRRYVSLEVDIAEGTRGSRGTTIERLLELTTGAPAAMVVNNNAAAVYIVANTLSPPGRVIVSRGELVEIGGSFRLPEILRHAAAEVVEVGTTNRTYASDYADVAREGDLILKVHKSNYAMEGFVHEAALPDLVGVGRDKGCAVVYDMGSGALFDFGAEGKGPDAHVRDVVSTGVDAVTMSGDKLLGGPQAGIIVGTDKLIAAVKQNPLRRAVRIDKVTVAALQAVLRGYLFSADPRSGTPAIDQILADGSAASARADAVARALEKKAPAGFAFSSEKDEGAVGGGSLAAESVDSAAVVIRCPSPERAVALARALRTGEPPVFTRIRNEEVRLNFATVLADEDELIRDAVSRALDGRNP